MLSYSFERPDIRKYFRHQVWIPTNFLLNDFLHLIYPKHFRLYTVPSLSSKNKIIHVQATMSRRFAHSGASPALKKCGRHWAPEARGSRRWGGRCRRGRVSPPHPCQLGVWGSVVTLRATQWTPTDVGFYNIQDTISYNWFRESDHVAAWLFVRRKWPLEGKFSRRRMRNVRYAF